MVGVDVAAGVQAPAVGVTAAGQPLQIVYDRAAVDSLRAEMAKLREQNNAIKKMARDAERKGEVAKHKSPQIKRSLSFLLDLKFELQDFKEVMSEAKGGDMPAMFMAMNELDGRLQNMCSKVENEILANQIASKADMGWRTVKHFESSSLFKGDDAEAQTKKLKSAEFQAAKDYYRNAKRGRGRG